MPRSGGAGACGFRLCPAGVDVRRFLPLLMVLLCEGVLASSMMSYVGFLVVDVGVAESEGDAGTWAGLLTSVFFLTQTVFGFVIGWLSDKFGRRPMLLYGLTGTLACQVAFGFVRNYWYAIAVRALLGVFNGNVGIAKTAIGELTDKSNRVKAFTFVGLMFGAGNVVGSTVSGLLARPAVQYPGRFSREGLFGRFPYLLPNIVTSAVVLASLVVALVFLKETRKPAEVRRRKPKDVEEVALRSVSAEALEERPETPTVRPGLSGLISPMIAGPVTYTIVCLGQIGVNVLVSTWSIAEVAEGGLGFSASAVGVVIAVGGVSMVLTLLFLAEPITKRLKVLGTMRLGSVAVFLVIAFLMPLANTCAKANFPKWALWTVMMTSVICWQMAAQMSMNNAIIMVSNSAPPHLLGRINGAAQSGGALMRAVGPFAVGSLLVWSLHGNRRCPLDFHLPFVITGAIFLLAALFSFLMPPSINNPYTKSQARDEKTLATLEDEEDSKEGERH